MTQTPYPDWLKSLGGLRADLSPAVRGLKVEHSLTYPGNVTTATLTGSVKLNPDNTAELATFTIGTPALVGGNTQWTFSLAAGSGSNSTGALPVDGDGNGVEYFVYDLLLTLSGGSAQRIAGGLFPVSGFVTEVA